MATLEPLNQACFSQPHWSVIAAGNSTESWFNDGQAVGSGGILSPKPVHLRVGQKHYRFASSTAPREAQLGGGWWIDFENFAVLKRFSEKQSCTLSDAARNFLALPYEWTRVDRLISAILEVPLNAYAGQGRTADTTGKDPRDAKTRWIPMQHRAVTQLYIPGLYVRGQSGKQLYEKAFPAPTFEYIAGNRKAAPTPR